DCVVAPEQAGKNFAAKVLQFVEHVRQRYTISQPVSITTHNHFPTAAGLASSASGFAALALGLNELFKLNLNKQELSQLARLGSGSAARSVFGGFVVWHKGLRTNGTDCFAEQLFPADHWPTLRIIVVVVDASVKKMSSREGMRLTVQTSPSFSSWCTESETRIAQMRQAIAARDLERVGQLTEADWYGMYHAMQDTTPSLNYLSNASWAVIETVRQLRATGVSCYFTTDAGPNVKILCEEKDADAVERAVATVAGVKQIMQCRVAGEPVARPFETSDYAPPFDKLRVNGGSAGFLRAIGKEQNNHNRNNIITSTFPPPVRPEPVEGANRTGIHTIKVPGKLMLAGEWSVLEPGNQCIVLPVNRLAVCQIQPAPAPTFSTPTLCTFNVPINYHNGMLSLESDNPTLNIARAALQTTVQFLHENNIALKPFALSVNTDQFFFKGQKVGFGSSAAVCVGITRALLEFHAFLPPFVLIPRPSTLRDRTLRVLPQGRREGPLVPSLVEGSGCSGLKAKNLQYPAKPVRPELVERVGRSWVEGPRLTVFKLATLAHYHAQKKIGSGFDIAASTFAQPILYQRFDAAWLATQETKKITDIVRQPWQDLAIQPITLPANLRLCVGFTGASASTTQLAQRITNFKNNQPDQYNAWCKAANYNVQILAKMLEKNDQEMIISLLNNQQKMLSILSKISDTQLETPALTALISSAQQAGAGAKFSGAGGGDCGIAVCFEKNIEEHIKDSWLKLGIEILEDITL
ncbi:diphosphomevalonate decarboxylase, partial [Candidatus Babeliales bacterium]|nr:diphosphomevalonate decarboxylase [Candidatus Babeliales bacterium]